MDDSADIDDLHPVDADALRRCMEHARREPGRREQLDSFLKGETVYSGPTLDRGRNVRRVVRAG